MNFETYINSQFLILVMLVVSAIVAIFVMGQIVLSNVKKIDGQPPPAHRKKKISVLLIAMTISVICGVSLKFSLNSTAPADVHQQAQDMIYDSVNRGSDQQKTAADTAVSPQIKQDLSSLGTSPASSTTASSPVVAYLYVGDFNNGQWISKNLTIASNGDINKEALLGTTVTATTDTYRRDAFPRPNKNGGWVLGNVMGVFRQGQSATVVDTYACPGSDGGELWWVAVNYNLSPSPY